MARALVTGVAGFMGSHVADECIKLGMEVVGVDDLSGGYKENVPEEVEFVQCSLESPEWIFDEHGPFDYIYHLGAYAAEGLSHFIREYNYQNNLLTSVRLINEAVKRNVKRFIFTSSVAVYGHRRGDLTEGTQCVPIDPYGISKYAVELDLQAAAKQFGLAYTIFRPHNVYGPRQNISDPYRNVVGIFMKQVIEGKPMTLFGDGNQTRSFSYIDNVAPIIAGAPKICGMGNQVFNIGTNISHKVIELAQIVAKEYQVPCTVTFLPERNEAYSACPEHNKIRKVLHSNNWRNKETVSIKVGIHKMREWLDVNPPSVPTYFTGNIEVDKNMPPSWLDAIKVPDPR